MHVVKKHNNQGLSATITHLIERKGGVIAPFSPQIKRPVTYVTGLFYGL
ncbi:hypothetical protein imdm_1645 [gamma proteobacterium IMCC2047]|nr:hypothetical protein imdm_1645 [gamma proteobacterium IMCC2047]